MHAELVGVAVEAAVVAVEDPSAQVRQVYLGDALQLLSDGAVGVLHGGGIRLRGRAEDIRALQSVQPRLSQEIHDRASADVLGVQVLVPLQDAVPLALLGYSCQQAVVAQVVHRRHGHTRQGHRTKHAGTEADSGDHVFLVRVDVADHLAQPALGAQGVRLTGMPDVHRAEVGAGRVLVTHAMDDGNLALLVDVMYGPHAGVEAQVVGDRQHLVLGNRDGGPVVAVKRVGEGYDRVQVVVAAR